MNCDTDEFNFMFHDSQGLVIRIGSEVSLKNRHGIFCYLGTVVSRLCDYNNRSVRIQVVSNDGQVFLYHPRELRLRKPTDLGQIECDLPSLGEINEENRARTTGQIEAYMMKKEQERIDRERMLQRRRNYYDTKVDWNKFQNMLS